MNKEKAINSHQNVPPDYYEKAINNNPLQKFWHRRRFINICKLAETVNGKVLDVGSADGTLTEVLLNKTEATGIVGIDILEDSVKYANKRFENDNRYSFIMADAHSLPFKDEQFGGIFCSDVFEHLYDPKKVLAEFKRVLKPRGYIVISVPTESMLFRFAWWIVLHTWGRHWQDTHIQDFRKNSLNFIFNGTGLTLEIHKKILWGMLQIVKVRK